MTETIEIEVSDETVAAEVAYGIIGRAQDIHNNPDDEYEDVAIELRDIGQEMIEEYE
jgi:hypothetical protein